jgi:hypothetical protein
MVPLPRSTGSVPEKVNCWWRVPLGAVEFMVRLKPYVVFPTLKVSSDPETLVAVGLQFDEVI